MSYHLRCTACNNEFNRPYLSFSKQCPKCGSRDLAIIKPSRTAGCVLTALGAGLLLIFACDMVTMFSAGPGGTIIGSLVKIFFGENITVFRYAILAVAVIALPITIISSSIAFGKRAE